MRSTLSLNSAKLPPILGSFADQPSLPGTPETIRRGEGCSIAASRCRGQGEEHPSTGKAGAAKQTAKTTEPVMDDIADLIQLEEENARSRKAESSRQHRSFAPICYKGVPSE